jgi:hypothetical protein
LKDMRFLGLLAVVLVASCASVSGLPPETERAIDSCQGKPSMPLPSYDYSTVGYMVGAQIPNKPATKTYPAGRITVTDQIILKDGDLLRGAGRDKTILYFPNGLKQMGLPCRHGQIITVTGPGKGDCFDWTSTKDGLFMGVIGAEGSEIGIEELTIEFPGNHPWQHYGNYDYTSGYNGVEFKCTNCWMKNVTIKNSDNGVFINRGGNIILEGLHVYARPGGGHLHVAYVASSGNLTNNFRMYGTSSHGLTMNWGAADGVFANGWGENLDIEPDHSCGAPRNPCSKNMLYSNISGTIRRFQTQDRAGKPVPAIRWNVGSVDRCPLDAYTAQRLLYGRWS